jgi:hypothetical protein
LPFFQDLQVIPKKYRITSEKQATFWLNVDFPWHRLRVSLESKQNRISSCCIHLNSTLAAKTKEY